jgi:hypothetical protein
VGFETNHYTRAFCERTQLVIWYWTYAVCS